MFAWQTQGGVNHLPQEEEDGNGGEGACFTNPRR